MIGANKELIKNKKILGKEILNLNAMEDQTLSNSYWKLDGNAFEKQSSDKWVKNDTLLLGGCPVVMFLPKEYVEKEVIEDLEANDLNYIPIGFIDLHKISEEKFSVSGLGIAKKYQGKNLSKYLIYAGMKIPEVKELYITTQTDNEMSSYAWKHMGKMKLLYKNPLHNEENSVVYEAKVPIPCEDIMKPIKI